MTLQSNNPTINDHFTDINVPVTDALNRFEKGNREIEHKISAVLQRINIEGHTIADLGSGTGVFIKPMIDAVGSNGRLYICEPAVKFQSLLNEKVSQLIPTQQQQCTIIQSKETDVMLPQHACDTILCFDVYHHFEYLEPTLTSIRNSLKPTGRFVVCDYYKRFNEWSQGHVRAEKEQCIDEITSNGFVVDEEITDVLKDNWLCVFKLKQ